MKPLAEHQTVLQVLREMVEEVILQASPAMAVVTAVDASGAVKVRLLDEEASRPLTQLRNPGMRLRVNDTVLVIRTLANELVVAFPVSSAATGTDAQRIGGEQIVDASVTGAKLADGSVTQAKLGTGAVTADKLGAGAVTADKIQTSAVTAGKIAAGAVGNAQIAGGAVTADKIASGVIPPAQVIPTQLPPTDNSVSTVKIQDRAVTSAKIADLQVTNAKINDGAVTPAKLDRIYANQGHTHNPADLTVNYNTLRCVGVTVRNANGVQSNTTLSAILNTLWSRSYGGSSGVAGGC